MVTATRKCALKSCSKRNPPETMIIKGVQAWCNHDCQTEHAMLNLKKMRASNDRAAKNAEKELRKESRRKREAYYANDPAKQKALTQTAANRLCMLLDKGKPCISSGLPDDGKSRKRNASHFKSRGSNSFLRYSMLNLHAATAHDNNFKSGNIEGYRKGLVERYGQWIVDYLDNAPRSKEWECAELIALRKELNAEIRHIEKGNPPTRNWRTPGDFDVLRSELPCNRISA